MKSFSLIRAELKHTNDNWNRNNGAVCSKLFLIQIIKFLNIFLLPWSSRRTQNPLKSSGLSLALILMSGRVHNSAGRSFIMVVIYYTYINALKKNGLQNVSEETWKLFCEKSQVGCRGRNVAGDSFKKM